jgi:thioredoxin-related protein
MKTILFMLLLGSGLFAGNALKEAQKLGAETDYATAISKAQKENKILVMVIVQENCRWCERLIDRTLSEASVKKELENYVTLIVDQGDTYPNIFKEDLFPAIFYIDAKSQKSIYTGVGYVDEKGFLSNLAESSETQEFLFEDGKSLE